MLNFSLPPWIPAAALFCLPLAAHDMWIEPTQFLPGAGQLVGVKLRVGQGLLGDPIPRNPVSIHQFVVADAALRRPVAGREGADPAGMLRVERPGLLVIGYHSNPSRTELEAKKFNEYLLEEGLESILAIRNRRQQSGAPARELFSRCAKTLVLSGQPGAAGDQVLGFPLELIAERNPYALGPRENLPLRLLYENRPLAGALVVAINRQRPAEKIAARTDRDGRVRLLLPAGGMWLVKAVHMVPAAPGTDADWASYWASLTFSADAAK